MDVYECVCLFACLIPVCCLFFSYAYNVLLLPLLLFFLVKGCLIPADHAHTHVSNRLYSIFAFYLSHTSSYITYNTLYLLMA